MTEQILFILLSGLALYGALVVVSQRHLVVCALHLAGTMLSLAGLFFILGAPFIAGVQVIVYAGAVMVLFIMVVMIFDLEKQSTDLLSQRLWIKAGLVFFLTGLIAGLLPLSLHFFKPLEFEKIIPTDTKDLAHLLFSKYVVGFEILGVLLLLIAVGTAVLCQKETGGK